MVTIRGTVINHFSLIDNQLSLVRVRPSAFTFNGKDWHLCIYSLSTNYEKEISLLHFTYHSSEVSVLSLLQTEDKIEMEVRSKSLFYKPNKLYGVKEGEEGLVRFINLNCRDKEHWDLNIPCRTVSRITILPSLEITEGKKWVKSSVEFIEKLGGFTLPTLSNPQLGLTIESSVEELVEV